MSSGEPDYSYGIRYTPASVSRDRTGTGVSLAPLRPGTGSDPFSSLSLSLSSSLDALDALDALGISYIRVSWLDYANQLRFHVLALPYFKQLMAGSRPGIALGKMNLGAVHMTFVDGTNGTGEWLYAFDAESFRVCPYTPGHASIMGFFQEKVPKPSVGLKPIPLCPRGLLKRVMEEARERAGITFVMGVESEFVLLRSVDPLTTQGDVDYATSRRLPNGGVETRVMQEIADGLRAAGIEVQRYHAEAAPGQYEVVTGPLTPLDAADALVATRELIYNVADKHGLRATFAPRIDEHAGGVGAHVHISVHNVGPTQSSSPNDPGTSHAPTLTHTERSFLQGLLTHLPALCAFTLPTTTSYARVGDHIFSGGTHAAWGTDNREAAIRLAGSSGSHHFEVRTSDATANPYVAFAAIIAAGMLGVVGGAKLESGDCPENVSDMGEEERRKAGVDKVRKLPRSIEEARKNLEGDKELRGVLGEEFLGAYMKVNKVLQEIMTEGDAEAQLKELINLY